MNKKTAVRTTRASALAVVAALASAGAWAADNDTQTVSFTISAINEIDVAAGPVNLTINSATAGSQPTAATAASSYSITTNAAADSKRITAQLDTAMPANVTLQVSVDAPSAGSSSAGTVTLSNTAADVVTGVETVIASGVAINYTLSATIDATPVTDSRTVTYTIVDAS